MTMILKYENINDIDEAEIPLKIKVDAYDLYYRNYCVLKKQLDINLAHRISISRVNTMILRYESGKGRK